MKKAEQKFFNDSVVCMYKICTPITGEYNRRKFRSCQAEVAENHSFYLLYSYGTLVACISKDYNICYDFLRYVYGYTATSAQHIAKFVKEFNATKKVTYKPV